MTELFSWLRKTPSQHVAWVLVLFTLKNKKARIAAWKKSFYSVCIDSTKISLYQNGRKGMEKKTERNSSWSEAYHITTRSSRMNSGLQNRAILSAQSQPDWSDSSFYWWPNSITKKKGQPKNFSRQRNRVVFQEPDQSPTWSQHYRACFSVLNVKLKAVTNE